jgi:hypothetical protein
VDACTLVNEDNGVVYRAVRVTLPVENPVHSPAIIIERSAGFDLGIRNGHQSVGGSDWNEALNTYHVMFIGPCIIVVTEE